MTLAIKREMRKSRNLMKNRVSSLKINFYNIEYHGLECFWLLFAGVYPPYLKLILNDIVVEVII
jgi:hypothetical protein